MTSTLAGAATPNPGGNSRYYTRFTPTQRLAHGVLVFTFLGLAATGLTLRFSAAPSATAFARLVGGFSAILFFHKFCAILLTAGFLAHVGDILYRAVIGKQWGLLWGPDSLVPNLKDIEDFLAHMKWFLFRGPKPKFDRYAYWEKVDYWAVFWGMAVIGLSGYAMWFAPFFSRLLPGSWLTVTLLIHGEEALLAVSFIFTIHFFNEHLRPHNFPMDITIFTGQQSEEEFKERHPAEYERLQESGALEALRSAPPPELVKKWSWMGGTTAIAAGIVLLVLTVRAFLKE
jgi:cytochrome b subunit of formate dehydrogenase